MPQRLTWQEKTLRRACGLPAIAPGGPQVIPDPEDPATRLLTTAEAAAAAHVDEATVRDWARRGLITPRYFELDVLQAEARTRRAARERRLADEAAQGLGSGAA